jgi:hypothetical protein
VPVYGSGGFTTYANAQLSEQLGGWTQQGIPRVKMKIGTDWGTRQAVDLERVRVARQAIGPDAELFVDANGAYTEKQAIFLAEQFAQLGVTGSRNAGRSTARFAGSERLWNMVAHLSSDWIFDTDMREYRPSDEVDFCIIGSGAGGGRARATFGAFRLFRRGSRGRPLARHGTRHGLRRGRARTTLLE